MIEELGKGAVLLLVAHQVHHREPRDGMVLGAVVGAGFAAFESAGYALQALLDNLDDQTVIAILEIEAFRAVLAPFGHITWTALIGGALFASSRGGRFHLSRGLVLTILGVVALHALWDQSTGWAVMLTKALVMDAGWDLAVAERAVLGHQPDRLRPGLVQRDLRRAARRLGPDRRDLDRLRLAPLRPRPRGRTRRERPTRRARLGDHATTPDHPRTAARQGQRRAAGRVRRARAGRAGGCSPRRARCVTWG